MLMECSAIYVKERFRQRLVPSPHLYEFVRCIQLEPNGISLVSWPHFVTEQRHRPLTCELKFYFQLGTLSRTENEGCCDVGSEWRVHPQKLTFCPAIFTPKEVLFMYLCEITIVSAGH